MKSLYTVVLQVVLLIVFCNTALSSPRSGFYLPDSVEVMTLRYKAVKGLIVLPVIINDSIRLNLILDTGCRNLVLFGKRFQKLLKLNPSRQIQFSGLGSGKPVHGFLSLSNKISIEQVLGESIPVVVVPERNVLGVYDNVHGVIGYDIFLKFEIELNTRAQTITFRPAMRAMAPSGYVRVPLQIIDSRPVMSSQILVDSDKNRKYDLMIDTGSTLGLLLKTTNMKEDFTYRTSQHIIGLGFNGPIMGYKTVADRLQLDGMDMVDLPTGIIESPWHNYASIGMQVLKDYVLVLNYCKAYACFRKHEG
jgi:hypothetical protein